MRGSILGGIGLAALSASVDRAIEVRKIYGAENIKRHLQRQKRGYRSSGGSLAPYSHLGEREIARRLRQEASNRERQAARFYGIGPRDLGVFDSETQTSRAVLGMSRRGRLVLA